MGERWIANPEMPKPFPLKLESIRRAAVERWGDAPILKMNFCCGSTLGAQTQRMFASTSQHANHPSQDRER